MNKLEKLRYILAKKIRTTEEISAYTMRTGCSHLSGCFWHELNAYKMILSLLEDENALDALFDIYAGDEEKLEKEMWRMIEEGSENV